MSDIWKNSKQQVIRVRILRSDTLPAPVTGIGVKA